MRIIESHPWHTECQCFETIVCEPGETAPGGCLPWIYGDNGVEVCYRRVFADRMDCVCRRCKITQETHRQLDAGENIP